MISIDWDEFKAFKKHTSKEGDNFQLLLEFLKSYYNMTSPREMYETMANDDIAGKNTLIHSYSRLIDHINQIVIYSLLMKTRRISGKLLLSICTLPSSMDRLQL